MANRKRNHVVRFYLSDAEFALFKDRIARSGKKTMSAFALDALLNSEIISQDYIDGINLINKNLSEIQRIDRGIGSNINQIAHRVNTYNTASHNDIEQLINEYHYNRAVKEAIWRQIKLYLAQLRHITN